MQEIEILIKDLSASKAQIELERGEKQTKEKIIDFIAEMLKGDPNDKEYQKLLIDNLVYKVFVYDDHIITYLTFGNDKEIKEISLADNDKAIDELKVQPLSSMVPLSGLEPIRLLQRGILRHMRQNWLIAKITKNRAFLAENRLKTPQNQTFPFVTNSLESATSQNFPIFFTENKFIIF